MQSTPIPAYPSLSWRRVHLRQSHHTYRIQSMYLADQSINLGLPFHARMIQGGIEKLSNLRVLYMSNNKIASWAEVDRLAALDKLEDLLLAGNPLYNDYRDNNATSEYRIEVGCMGIIMLACVRQLIGKQPARYWWLWGGADAEHCHKGFTEGVHWEEEARQE